MAFAALDSCDGDASGALLRCRGARLLRRRPVANAIARAGLMTPRLVADSEAHGCGVGQLPIGDGAGALVPGELAPGTSAPPDAEVMQYRCFAAHCG